MRKVYSIFIIGFLCLAACQSQEAKGDKNRSPARAGQFYPGSKKELSQMIEGFLKYAKSSSISGEIVGILVPHAGYVFSGQVAAHAYRVIQDHDFDAVLIIGPSHTMYLKGASIGKWKAYNTPLGDAVVDVNLAEKIRSSSPLITSVMQAHTQEHSVEVQIPFIQTVLPDVPIVPMVIGQVSDEDSKEIARAIVSALKGKRVLLVASSDLSHYPSYKDACRVDQRVLEAVKSYDVKKISSLNETILKERIPNLSCALCGSQALTTIMRAARELGANQVEILPYANSGDISGRRDQVVGYGAAIFYHGEEKMSEPNGVLKEIDFTEDEKKKLLSIARESILVALKRKKVPEFIVEESNLKINRGVFVTLTNRGQLRGCIGHFGQDKSLYEIVSQMAAAAATQDYRFVSDPITSEEMNKIDIKISILSDLKKVNSVEEIEVGKHGIWITQGSRSGTYLPEVATDQGWDREMFLTHCCTYKAGLAPDAWRKDADVFIYTSQILDEKELK